MAKFSTGLRTGMLNATGAKAALNSGFLKIYSGTVPADADAALGGATLLCTVSNASTGTGVTFDAPAAGVLSKAAAETWSGVNAATGTGTFFRFVAAADDGTLSTSAPRVQGTISAAGTGDMNLATATFTSAATFTLNYFSVDLPTY